MSRRRDQRELCGDRCGCQHGCMLDDRADFYAEDDRGRDLDDDGRAVGIG